MTGDRRTEVLSLRLSAEEKQRLTEAAERGRVLAEATDQPAKSLSDWAREQLLRHADDIAVFPSQNVTITRPESDDRLLIERIRKVLREQGAGNWL